MSIKNFDTNLIASGFKYLPFAFAVEGAIMATGIMANWFSWKVVKDAWIPTECDFLDLDTLSMMKRVAMIPAATALIWFPFATIEEILYRGILPDGLLTKVPRKFFNLYGKGHWVDSNIAKVARDVISSTAFAAMHIPGNVGTPEQVLLQTVMSFGFGLTAAVIKEKTGSIWPGTVLHMARNALVMAPHIACSGIIPGLSDSVIRSSNPTEPESKPTPSLPEPQSLHTDEPKRELFTNSSFCPANDRSQDI